MSQFIITLRGDTIIVDDEDYAYLKQFAWHTIKAKTTRSRYAIRYLYHGGRNNKTSVSMHRELLGMTDPAKKVDHINHDGLDNRRENLRPASDQQNAANSRKVTHFRNKPPSSQYKGVSKCSDSKNYRCRIIVNGIRHNLGCFAKDIEAAHAYDRAATKLNGEFAGLNFPQGAHAA